MGDQTTRPKNRRAARLGPVAIRRLRIAAACGIVALIILGGAATLWLTRRGPDSTTAASRAERSSAPVRLDTLPGAGSSERPRGPGASAEAGPSEDRPQSGEGHSGAGGGDGGAGRESSGPGMRAHVAALAQVSPEVGPLASGRSSSDPGTGEIVWPVDGRVLLRFGALWGKQHPGIDIAVRSGTAVHAADWGRVVFTGTMGGYGKLVCIQHTQDLSTCYGQLSKIRVRQGESVGSGEVIARSGCSGKCYADQLHFEVRQDGRPVSPRQYLGPPLSAIR